MEYYDLFNMDLDTNLLGLPGNSSASLIAFADNMALNHLSEQATEILEERTNEAMEKVSAWMKENDLRLAAEKTECVVLTKKRSYRKPMFKINNIRVEPKEKLTYLGKELSKKLGNGTYIRSAAVRAEKTTSAIEMI
jgi:hypothetical protein